METPTTRLKPEPGRRWNTMKDMRKALGLPLGTDGITEFLLYWDSLPQDLRERFRRDDLNNIDDWDFPRPSIDNKENEDG